MYILLSWEKMLNDKMFSEKMFFPIVFLLIQKIFNFYMQNLFL